MKVSPVIPTIFSNTKKEFTTRFKRLVDISPWLHIDFMDGEFVPGTSITPHEVPKLQQYQSNFEAHLMVSQPEKYIPALAKKGFKRVIFHYESNPTKSAILQTIAAIKAAGMAPVLALNPSTPIEKCFPFIEQIPVLLLMGINPGKEQQAFMPKVYQKIRRLREKDKRISIQVDGGVNVETIQKIARAGGTLYNSGSFVSKNPNPQRAIKMLELSAEHGSKARKEVWRVSKPYDRITPYIYIGPNRCCILPGFDEKLLKLGIAADISLEEFRIDKPHGVKQYLWLPTPDHEAPTVQQLCSGVAFLTALVKQRVKTYVHCELGRTRAPTFVAAYLITQGKSIDAAVAFIKKKRPSIGITEAQRKGLEKFAKAWKRQ